MTKAIKNHQLNIAIFGEILADIFPDNTVLGGAPYNVARHLRAFNTHPLLISRVGNDALKTKLFEALENYNLDCSGIQIDAVYPTGQVIVRMENKYHSFEIRSDQAYDFIDSVTAQHSIQSIKPAFAYFGSLAQRNQISRLALTTCFNAISCPIFLDLNLRAPWYDKDVIHHSLMLAKYVKLNEDELTVVSEFFSIPKNMGEVERAACIIQQFNLKHLFVTCGENGAWALSETGELKEVKGQPLTSKLVDTVGAGDAFSAACIVGLLQDWPMDTILIRATNFASALCCIRGATPESNDFYLPFMTKWRE